MKILRSTLIPLVLCNVLIGTMIISTNQPVQARGHGPCSATRYEVDHAMPATERVDRVKALIRCVFTAFNIAEEIPRAIAVTDRESGFRPWATNPVSAGVCRPWSSSPFGSCGLQQHLSRYWPGRVGAYLHARWFPGTWPHVPILQARANTIVTALMVKHEGWGAWSTAW